MMAAFTNHLWQSTLVAGAALVPAAALRNHQAHVRYWVWLAASVKFSIAFSVLTSLGRELPWTSAVSAMATPSVPAFSRAVEHIAQPFSRAFPPASATPVSIVDWSSVFIGVWLCGAAALALTRLREWRRIRAAVRASTPATISGVGLPARVQVRSTPSLLEPGVVGFWHPILLVPAGLEAHLTPPQLEAVLAHELCHVRRRDNLTAAIHMIVEAVFWFHPLVWWIGGRLVDERERACDEHVLRVVGTPQAYAEGILEVCRLYVASPLACVPGVTGSNLKKRIEDIMMNRIGRRLNVGGKVALCFAAGMVVALPVAAGMLTAPLQSVSGHAAPAQARAVLQKKLVTWRTALGQTSDARRTKEPQLKEMLLQMRDAIDRYRADKKRYPSSLDTLVREGYIRTIPTDPFTNRADSWRTIPVDRDQSNPAAAPGITDVRSGSDATALDGSRYSNW